MESALREILAEKWSELDEKKSKQLSDYFNLLIQGNQKQNLTRITDPTDFFAEISDMRELNRLNWINGSALDYGSGSGLVGIVMAILGSNTQWTLAESEKRKAAFIKETVRTLGLENVAVHAGRAEVWLSSHETDFVVAKAAGSVGQIWRYLKRCSTWNTMILFKGPKWEEEWSDFQKKSSGKLILEEKHSFQTSPDALHDAKNRILVRLDVPRGTLL